MRLQSPNLSRLVNPLIKAAEKIEKAIDHRGYVKIKTFTEHNRELRTSLEQTMRRGEEAQREAERRREEHNEEIRKRLEQNEQNEE